MYKPVYNKIKKIGQFSLLACSIAFNSHIVYGTTLENYNKADYQDDYWRLYPISLQIHVHNGVSLPINLIALPQETEENQELRLLGFGADLNMLYLNRSLWKYFNCYPRLGITLNYHKLIDQGDIYSGLIYIEPNYNDSRGYEFLAKLGAGIAYTKIRGYYYASRPEPDAVTPDINDYMQGPALALALDIGLRFRLSPKWNFYAGWEMNYLLALHAAKDTNGNLLPRNRLTLSNFNFGSSYTFNLNPKTFIRPPVSQKSRIDVGNFYAFAKDPSEALSNVAGQVNAAQSEEAIDTTSQIEDKKLYYLVGVYAQGSLRIANNHALTIGSEWVYNSALKENHAQEDGKKSAFLSILKTSKFQKSILLGHEFLWGKIVFGQAIGMYVFNEVYQENPVFGSFYTRLSLNCYITRFLSVGTSVKTTILPKKGQYVALDYVDFRFGYSF